MLVLSRKKQESICIGDQTKVIVVDIRGDKVRIGIEAPQDIAVHREEIFNAITREQDGKPLSHEQQVELTRELELIVTNAIHAKGYRTAPASMCIEHSCKTISTRVSISS